MYKASLTSKGQITIPKEVRELLGLETGDTVLFKVDDKTNVIIFEKDIEMTACPVCSGRGEISSLNIKDNSLVFYKCPVCQSTGSVKKLISAIAEISNLMRISLEYRIAVTLVQADNHILNNPVADNHILNNPVPEIKLRSDLYPPELIAHIQKYYQEKLDREYGTDIDHSLIFKIIEDACSEVIETELGDQEPFFRSIITEQAYSILKNIALKINENPSLADEVIASTKDLKTLESMIDQLSLNSLLNDVHPQMKDSVLLTIRLVIVKISDLLRQISN